MDLLKSDSYSIVVPTERIASRNTPSFRSIFAKSDLVSAESDDTRRDPLNIEETWGAVGNRREYLPLGPFNLYEVRTRGAAVRIIAASGFKEDGKHDRPTLRAVTYYELNRPNPCAPAMVLTSGHLDHHFAADYWSGLIKIKDSIYVLSLTQYDKNSSYWSVEVGALPRPKTTKGKKSWASFSVK